MDLEALAAIFAHEPGAVREPSRPRPDLQPMAPAPSEPPRALPAVPAPGNPIAAAPDRQEARAERAAIMEIEGGLSQEAAEAQAAWLHPDPWTPAPGASLYGYTLAELRTAAGEDWPEIVAHPETLQAFAFLRWTRAQLDRGERPEHYTRAALCATCGPVWLWDPGPARVLACPWCLALPPAGVAIPRPPVRCGTCRHFAASATDPAAGVGACRIEAPASRTGPALWPQVRRPCGAWREAVVRVNPFTPTAPEEPGP